MSKKVSGRKSGCRNQTGIAVDGKTKNAGEPMTLDQVRAELKPLKG